MTAKEQAPNRRKEEQVPTPSDAKLHEAAQPKEGWDALGAFKGRSRPDGLGRRWQ